MELEDTDITTYLDDMIKLLEDGKEIKEREESKEAVKKLLELKQEKFIISTTDENEIRIAMAAVAEKEKNLEQKIVDAKKKIGEATDESEQQVKTTGSAIIDEFAQKGVEMKKDLKKTELHIKERLQQTEKEIKEALGKSEVDLTETIDQKQIEIKENLRMTEFDSKVRLKQKETEIKENLRMTEFDSKVRLKQKETEIKENLKMTEVDSKERLKQKETEIKKNLRKTEVDSNERLNQKEIEIKKNLRMTEVEANERLDKKGKEIEEDLERKGKHILYQLDRKQSAPVHIEPRRSEDISKEAVDDLMKAGLNDNPLQTDNERKRAEFQEKLVKRYEKYVRKVSSAPLKPHRKQGNVSDVYVPPWMTVEIKNEEYNGWKEVEISMHEMFRNKERPAKYIYVIGDAGTGKSMFCKMLVHFWRIAHSNQESSSDESDIVKEMKRFEFLFYVSLRHFSDCDSIEKMLEKSYRDPALGGILQNDSSKCFIVLDGLDEWTPESIHVSQFLTPGLPGRELDADYTIITTSRQWKFDTLQISDSEVDKRIKLRGIDTYQMKHFTEKTVKMLNDSFKQSKNAKTCNTFLQSRRVSDISHIPLILQQLICLWFDDKLRENSKYAIYSYMLALFFEWNTLKTTSKHQECEIVTQAHLHELPLPDYLCDLKVFRENIRVIQYLSQLAYRTLFDKDKETSLTFSNSALEHMNIPNDVIKYCLNIGVLTEEQDVSLPASSSQQSLFSFFHKSMQEYLAAVYVASQLKEMLKSRKLFPKDNDDLIDVYKTFVGKHFGSCETVVDILDQSNVLIMLCGLEPQLLTNVSEYIYDVTFIDKLVVEERNTLPENIGSTKHHDLIKDIQTCIFLCIEEVMSSAKDADTPVYIADIYVSRSTDLLRYCKNVVWKNVLSICLDYPRFRMRETDTDTIYLVMKHLGKCDQLKAIKFNISDDRMYKEITKILDTNVFTLETVSVIDTNTKIITHLVSILPKMQRLTSLQMNSKYSGSFPHDECLTLCKYLNQTKSLKHIAFNIYCKECDEHMIDLPRHRQLKHVDFMWSTFWMVRCNTDILETCKLSIKSIDMMSQVYNSLYKADKLKHLELLGYHSDKTVTESLTRLLSSLVSLSTLTLRKFTFTDNIIARPYDMKNLKEITLESVTMSMTTRCKFIDSLPALPQVAMVKTFGMDMSDGTICEHKTRGEKLNAHQFVREKTNLFRVICDNNFAFQFTTKKV